MKDPESWDANLSDICVAYTSNQSCQGKLAFGHYDHFSSVNTHLGPNGVRRKTRDLQCS